MPLNRVDINDAYLIVYDQRIRWYEVKFKLNRAGDGTCHHLTECYFTNFIGMNALLFDYPMQTRLRMYVNLLVL